MALSYLIYHPRRCQTVIGNMKVYHDKFGGNEDPYIWDNKFLHTYCHITQLTNEEGQINFWVSGNSYPNFTQLFCDCVFVIDKKYFWKNANNIDMNDPIVDNNQTYEHHYKWHLQHPMKRRRYTLKADSEKSFQPQDVNKNLIDIVPFLNQQGITTDKLIQVIAMTKNRKRTISSRPFPLEMDIGLKLYDYLFSISTIKLFGKQLRNKHPNTNIYNES
ncbi:MAG: hypothetical protein WCL51_12455 [Bacteroidota bacterium]